MQKNMGNTDKTIRVLVAIVFIVLYASGVISGTPGLLLLILAAVFLLTSIAGFCPLYLPFGIKTNKRSAALKQEKRTNA